MHRENDKIERYKTYLRLEKALSANSIDAYLTDLDKTDKLRTKAKARSMRMSHMTTCNSLLPAYMISASTHVHRQGSFQGSNLSTGSCSWTII